MIKSLLIANRGEIACRIIRSARQMGVRTIAVYSDADAKALHVRMADEAVYIGPSEAAQSYLVGEKIIKAAKESGAEAIHPGYGFLSENADFAQSVIDAGIIWVGPKPQSIRAMGLKDSAKKLMQDAGVPVTPGYMGDNQDAVYLAQQADEIGYPVLIKAIAGGGGKGMRKVDNPADFADNLTSCQREAKASFSNDIVLIEKWIESPRHIEVQVFGDSHGNVVHLFERDCSLQRRHQKVIEEAPAPGMDEATREAVCGAAVRAAKAVGYEGAGTIEFIADGSSGLDADKIWFMEMNTRLQVEHPVTEEITGVDLVEWQLRVASGEEIPKKQDELSINGHAIEARLYAEDPANGFLPSIGKLEIFNIKKASLRSENAVVQNDTITPFYDPMIAKAIAHGVDRVSSIEKLSLAIDGFEIWPVKTNAGFLFRCLTNKDFNDAKLSTGLIEENINNLCSPDESLKDYMLDNAAIGLMGTEFSGSVGIYGTIREDVENLYGGGPFKQTLNFRLNAPQKTEVSMTVDGVTHERSLPKDYLDRYMSTEPYNNGIVAFVEGEAIFATTRVEGKAAGATSDGAILSPMPGKIIAVEISEGDAVTKGQKLLTLEAMKMEHSLTAPFDGVVTSLNAAVDGQVQVDAMLAQIEEAE